MNRYEAIRELGYNSFYDFVQLCWRVLEPKTVFIENWHIQKICECLEMVSTGKIQNLLINIPPRCMKSLLVSVFWPVWQWLRNPGHRFLCASYAQTLSTRDAVKARRLLNSPFFIKHFGDIVKLHDDQNTKNRYDNTKMGYRIATSVGGIGTGEGGDTIIVDDPHNTQGALSERKREECIIWWDETMSTRLNDAKTGSKIVVMQRLHEQDLTGHILQQEPGEWFHLCLPMRYEGGENDERKNDGELLWPAKFPEAEIKKLEIRLGNYGTAAQLQMRPGPRGGNILNVDNVQIYDTMKTWPRMKWMRVVDFAHSKKQRTGHDPDYTSATLMAIYENNLYVRHVFRTRAAVTERDKQLDSVIATDPPGTYLVLERTTDSLDACEQFKERYRGARIVKEYTPKADKVVRASWLEPLFDAGNVHVLSGEWLVNWMDELRAFPAASHDDMVDNLTAGFASANIKTGLGALAS